MVWTTPKTWNVGDVLTSTDLNTYVRDNSSYLYGDVAEIAITPSTNWGFNGSYINGVRRVGSTIVLSFVLTNNTGATVAAVATVAQLATGYTPPAAIMTAGSGNGAYIRMDIGASGTIQIDTGSIPAGGYLGLSCSYSLV